MREIEIRKCQAECHPFKQKTYKYERSLQGKIRTMSPMYCSSCSYYIETMFVLFKAILEPRETLYGGKKIQLTKLQATRLLRLAYDDTQDSKGGGDD